MQIFLGYFFHSLCSFFLILEVVSRDGRKVKRLHPLPLSEIKDPKVLLLLLELDEYNLN